MSYMDIINRNLAVISQELSIRHSLELEPKVVYEFACLGISKFKICDLYHCDHNYIDEDPALLAVYNQGRANIGTKVRSSIIVDALDKDILQAKIHLDKIYNKEDASVHQVDVTVNQRPLEEIDTNNLIEIMYKDEGK